MAAALDWFFASGACIILIFILSLLIGDKIARITLALSLLMVIPIVNFVYHVIMESSAKQGTYGKQILRIKVCDMQGERISAEHAIGRNIAKLFSVMTFFVGYLFAFFTKQQQCLHDMIANTLVMKDRLI
jgi:uncharacterized RDD family membrane protein YckC